MSMEFPAPGDNISVKIEDGVYCRTVIASTHYDDERISVVFLNKVMPYYGVAILAPAEYGTLWQAEHLEWHMNIGPAVVDGYANIGGDW